MKEFENDYKETEFVKKISPQNCRVSDMSLLRQSTNNNTIVFPDSIREKQELLNITCKIQKNGVKQRLRRYLQHLFDSYQRIDNIRLKTRIGTQIKKFKNKQIIEVSNPQTDYRYYRRI